MRADPEKFLVLLLRSVGALELLALPAVVIPFHWMEATHRLLGFGELPDEPIVGYLARSLSAFYALHGAVSLFISFDLRWYWPFLRFWAISSTVLGAVLVGIDLVVGMPLFWTASEGPFAVLFGLVLLGLQRQAERSGLREHTS